MNKKYILAVDQSTSGTKVLVVDSNGIIHRKKSINHEQIYPKSGWVEHNPIVIYENVRSIINEIAEEEKNVDFEVLTITNQRETCVVWDKETGIPIYNAIVWQCRRTSSICELLKQEGHEDIVQEKTGLKLDSYFSAPKVKWILDNVSGAREKAVEGKLLLGTIDCWLIWKLTNGKVHATDVTNASRTLLLNIHSLAWDDELLQIFGIPRNMLPEVKSSNGLFGETEVADIPFTIPISGVIGDSQAALFGQHCFNKGMAKATFGTGTSVLVQTEKLVNGKNGLVSSVAWGIDGEVKYALEGIINTTGDIIKWVKEDLELISDINEAELLAKSIPSNEGVYLIPAFVGLGAPYWDSDARAAITGMSRSTRRAHIVRAALESIVYQVKDIVELLQTDFGISLKELRVDGGATSNQFLMQFLADILDEKIIVSKIQELSALGSVYLGGLGVGIWQSIGDLEKINQYSTKYTPLIEEVEREEYYMNWKAAISKILVTDKE